MKPFLRDTLERQRLRLHELDALLSAPDATSDMARFRQLTRDHAETDALVQVYLRHQQRERDLAAAQAMAGDADAEMAAMAADEIDSAQAELAALDAELQLMLLPKDPDDERHAFLEIRAGTGGDESALFSGDLLRMYTRYAEQRGWRVELMSESPSELGGYKEVIARIEGDGAYGRLKFESGAHRVQRVPATEAQGRIHTSACTVAIMAEADEMSEIVINPADLRIDTFRASGAGGQHVNKTDSAIRITHLPSGIVVTSSEKSQHQNRARAMKVLQARLYDMQRSALDNARADSRKSQVGSGDRSERIRTYNFPQGRVTDHRINLTLYSLPKLLEGDGLDEMIKALIAEDQAERLASLEDEYG